MKTQNQITTQPALRNAFWEAHPQFAPERKASKRQNDYRADIRMAFVDYVDSLSRNGGISEALAGRATL